MYMTAWQYCLFTLGIAGLTGLISHLLGHTAFVGGMVVTALLMALQAPLYIRKRPVSSAEEHRPSKPTVTGSNPVRGSK